MENQIDAFRKVSEVERFLETDFNFIKGLIDSLNENEVNGEKIYEELVEMLHFYICGKAIEKHLQNKHIREVVQNVVDSII